MSDKASEDHGRVAKDNSDSHVQIENRARDKRDDQRPQDHHQDQQHDCSENQTENKELNDQTQTHEAQQNTELQDHSLDGQQKGLRGENENEMIEEGAVSTPTSVAATLPILTTSPPSSKSGEDNDDDEDENDDDHDDDHTDTDEQMSRKSSVSSASSADWPSDISCDAPTSISESPRNSPSTPECDRTKPSSPSSIDDAGVDATIVTSPVTMTSQSVNRWTSNGLNVMSTLTVPVPRRQLSRPKSVERDESLCPAAWMSPPADVTNDWYDHVTAH